MKSFHSKFVATIVTVIIFLFGFATRGECREVVFVINSGQSMNSYDPFHTAPESVIWGAQNFSADDEVGIIAFDDYVRVIRPLSKVGDNLVANFSVEYSGWSDAGAGLLAALDMLSSKFNTQRDIIFITNGEIGNSQSSINFKAGLEQAKWLGVSIYYVNLRYNVDPTNYQAYPNYVKDFPINYNELMTTIRTILQGDWNTPHITLPTPNLTTGNVKFEVPVPAAERFKISLLSSRAGTGVLRGVQPTSTIKGNYIKIFDIKSPSTNRFEMALEFPQGTGLTLDVIPTVKGTLQTSATRLFLLKDQLEVTPVYANDTAPKILGDKFFDGKSIRLTINNTNVVGKIQDGIINVSLDGFDEHISIQKIFFEDVGIVFDGDDTAKLFAPTKHYWAWILAAICVMIICSLSFRIYRKNSKPVQLENIRTLFEISKRKVIPPVENMQPVVKDDTFTYSGKLRLYFIKMPGEDHFEPREFNLFRMNSAQVSLAYILEQCAIDKKFSGFQNVLIKPAKSCIVVENNSGCTITKRSELVANGRQVELYYDDSINVLTDDETAEIIFQYKSLKPN